VVFLKYELLAAFTEAEKVEPGLAFSLWE